MMNLLKITVVIMKLIQTDFFEHVGYGIGKVSDGVKSFVGNVADELK